MTPTNEELRQAFAMTPADAVAFFRSNGYAVSDRWFDLWRDAHSRAFTVAKIFDLDALALIRQVSEQALSDGITRAEFSQRLQAQLLAGGFIAEASKLVPRRIDLIFRQNLLAAYNIGRWRQFEADADRRPFIQYITRDDARVRNSHQPWHRKVFRIDDPIWSIISPPNGFRCRCRPRALTAEQVADQGLTVENSDGRIVAGSFTVNGESRIVQGYADPVSGQHIYPDPGFDYNPALARPPQFPSEQSHGALPGFSVPTDRWPGAIAAAGEQRQNPWTPGGLRNAGLAVKDLIGRLSLALGFTARRSSAEARAVEVEANRATEGSL